MSRRIGAVVALTGLFLTTFAFGAPMVGAQQQKTPRTKAPALTSKFRQKLAEREKAAARRAPARLEASATDAARTRANEFAARRSPDAAVARTAKGAPRVAIDSKRPTLDGAARIRGSEKLRGTTFEGRHGTGLGDIAEQEPNDSTANILDDLPVNVVGFIGTNGDFDYYAITATQGESIRIEVVADRIFNSSLDSFLFVLAEDGETELASNDDAFSGSTDSFIRFIAPTAGTQVYFIGVTDLNGAGGSTFGYVLNVTVAEAPDFSEVEPNDTTSLADVFPVPSVGFGFSDEFTDLDVYVFDGVIGQALIVDVDAEIFLSLMDPVVELYDDNGGFLFGVDDADGLDPRFNIILPYTGEYFIVVYDRLGEAGDDYYYSMNLSTQSGVGAPRIVSYTLINNQLLKRVNGTGFTAANGGSDAEINSVEVPSRPAPRKPTTRVKLTPARDVDRGDVVTIVNPDGRRSNPGVIE